MNAIEKGKHDYTEFSIFEHRDGYVVESVTRAMWNVFRKLHDKYGRQYKTNLFHNEEDIDQIRSEEVFPDLQSVKEYISRNFRTEEQIVESQRRKKQELEKELEATKARVKELEKQLAGQYNGV